MPASKSVDEFIAQLRDRQVELETLRSYLLSIGLEEGIKWGMPTYMTQGKNVIGFGLMKNWISLWFFDGVFLQDPLQVLINAQENKTKSMRQWRLQSQEEIIKYQKEIKNYALEAKNNAEQGKKLPKSKPSSSPMPHELSVMLDRYPHLTDTFRSLAPYKQNEYKDYISEAKRPETKSKRIEKIKLQLSLGLGLHDMYKK